MVCCECCFCCSCEEPIDYENAEVDLYHFELHRALGKGAFGKVRVVEHKRNRKLYALKYIDKSQCISMKAVSNIVQERRLLEEIDHPFVVNMRFAFQDDHNCFMVLDLMLGGDLRFHARRINCDEATIRVYMAEISSAVAFLHSKNIIHRDIKPDNVLLDEQGHAHLTDFNVACHINPGRGLTSIAGTVYYMAPEMISRKGYTWTVDWWSLGVMAYELLFGDRPFDGRKTADVMRKIVSEPVEVPEKAPRKISPDGVDFVMRLLDRNTNKRLGCRSVDVSLTQIRSHPWFGGIDFAAVDSKSLKAPYAPDASKLNFDMTMELDEYMSPGQLLTHKKRKDRDLDKHPHGQDLRRLEDEFTPWDYQKMTRKSYHGVTQMVKTVKPSAVESAGGTPVPSRPGTAQGNYDPPTMPAAAATRSRASDVAASMEMDDIQAARPRRTPQVSHENLPAPAMPERARTRST